MGIGMVALALSAVYRGTSSSARTPPRRPRRPASTLASEHGARHVRGAVRRARACGLSAPLRRRWSRSRHRAGDAALTGARGIDRAEVVGRHRSVYVGPRPTYPVLMAGRRNPPEGTPDGGSGGGDDEYRSVVFDESFIKAARIQEFSAQERMEDEEHAAVRSASSPAPRRAAEQARPAAQPITPPGRASCWSC